MNDTKVYSAFHNLEKLSSGIRLEVDILMKNITEWAEDLEGILEKESKASSSFLLPKTPKERRTCRRKARNVLNSNSSVINSTFLQNESCNLDGSISMRTRNARRGATSKLSELNVTKNSNLEKSKPIIEENEIINASEVTLVIPKASTRTKPVLKAKQLKVLVPVPEPEKNEVSNAITVPVESISQQKKVSRIEPEGSTRDEISKTPAESSEERLSPEKTPIVNETPVKRVSRRKTARPLSESPAERTGRRRVGRNLSGSPAESTGTMKVSRTLSGSPAESTGPRKVPRTHSGSPPERTSRRKVGRTLSRSPAVARGGSANSRNPNKSPTERTSGLRSSRSVSGGLRTRSGGRNKSLEQNATSPENRWSLGERTITIKKELTSTFVVADKMCENVGSDNERTPVVIEKRFYRISKTSTPGIDLEKTPVVEVQYAPLEENGNATNTEASVNETEEAVDGSVPKKKRKIKKEEVKENIQEPQETMRITRTKSKAIRQMMEEQEAKQPDLSSLAKKVLNKAKMTSVKKSKLAALLECNSSTPKQVGNVLPFGNLIESKSKYHLLLSSSKLKTPMSVLKASGDRNRPKIPNGHPGVENLTSTATKPPKGDLERKIKLKARQEKEEEAALKRLNVIKFKQEELRRKNELKHQMALKQREKLEQEKYHNMIQLEKEKEERHKLILQERQAKVKEEALKRKILTQQKIAETVERRRMEEEARIAKLKEMEAEEQRLALERQKEQERQEKRAQERLAQKKAREEYEMQMKQELEAERLKLEKVVTAKKCLPSASKMQSANKRQKFAIVGEKREWDYKPRNEYDLGLEDENSEVDSEDEKTCSKNKPVMPWAKEILDHKVPALKLVTLEMLCEYMTCYQKSPDIHKMFKMTPSKRIKRSSSAIWNTPSS